MFFISSAYAQAAAAPTASGFASFAPLVLIVAIFYFLIIRPQQKKFKEHQALLQSITKGDYVVTAGGVIGRVVNVNEEKNILDIEIATDVVVQVRQATILEKTEKPAGKTASKASKKAKKEPTLKSKKKAA